MRGRQVRQLAILSSVSTEDLIPKDHPIRRIRTAVDEVLVELDADFDKMYSVEGRPSIPPEQLLKSQVLMALYSIRSERQFCERLNYDLLFKWFLGLAIDDRAFNASTLSKNQDRLLGKDIAVRFFEVVLDQARLRRYLSSDHFSVDGTVLEAWASHKSFKPKDRDPDTDEQSPGRNAETDFHGEKRSNKTHESTTDPEARLYRKSNAAPAKMAYLGHILIENRNGLIVDMELNTADGYGERAAAIAMLERLPKRSRRRTVAADKAYDTKDFVADCRQRGFTPHVSQNMNGRRSAIDGRTTRHAGHAVSVRIRKRVEEPFGWIKTVGGGRKLRYRGRKRNRKWWFTVGATYNLVRIINLDTATI